ncbi:YdeI/OmpD-associated family protein [Nonomuraea rosea]|uniref:YdeI/OmpD-associated family protein n=2 Tax=Nonomuraea rosea TaxID=638574 RepID=A0ABP6Z237_9ACTN
MFVPVPFDPDVVWAPKPVHHVTGTLNGRGVRAVLIEHEGERGFLLGPAWLRCGVEPGTQVSVVLRPEGPQRADLAEDVAAALAASPAAGAFFDSLAQFYRRGYLRWIDGTKRRPEVRAQRIAEMVQLLESGVKQRP